MKLLLPEQDSELRGFYRTLLQEPPQLSVADWCEENVIFPVGMETYAGRADWTDAPYAREPLECYADIEVQEMVLVFGTQCLKTTIMRCGAMFRIVHNPNPRLWVMPNEDKIAAPFSKDRWQPMLRDCRATARLRPTTANDKVDRTLFSTLDQQFTNGGTQRFRGSNSPANLSGFPIVDLDMDELDKFAQESDYEPEALNNAEQRTKNAAFRKIVKASTPTLADRGIWKEFVNTDQRYWMVPCPRCERRIRLRFRVKSEEHGWCGLRWYKEAPEEVRKDGKWDLDAVRQAAHYRCQCCGKAILNSERRGMVQAGRWEAHNPSAPRRRRGYHLSSLYSLVSDQCSFGAVAENWCEKSGNSSGRHTIINSTFAEPWNLADAFDEDRVQTSAYEIRAADLPPGHERYATIDFQLNHFWMVVREWAPMSEERPFGESWVLFADIVETDLECEGHRLKYGVPAKETWLDIAGRPNAAGQLINKYGWMGFLGSDNKVFPHRLGPGNTVQRVYSEVEWRDAHQGTRQQNKGKENFFPFIKWCKDPVREQVKGLQGKTSADGKPIHHIHAHVHKEYQRHMNAHVMQVRVNARGQRDTFWLELKGVPDHLWDCECMQAARALMRGMTPLLDIRQEQQELFGA